MQKYKIISFIFLIIVIVLSLGAGLCMIHNTNLKNMYNILKTQKEGFFTKVITEQVRYKNRENLFMFCSLLQDNERYNLYNILKENGHVEWYKKYNQLFTTTTLESKNPISLNLTSTFGPNSPFFQFKITKEEVKKEEGQEDDGSSFYYNVLEKNYLILNDSDFQNFIQSLDDILTYYSQEDLSNFNILHDVGSYVNYEKYSYLMEMLVVSAYVPSALEHMYLLPYNKLLKLFPNTFSNYEDFTMFVRLYTCANQMNLASNNTMDTNGNPLPFINYTTDITVKNTNDNYLIPLNKSVSSYFRNIIFMFNDNNVSDFISTIKYSYVYFYNAMQYFVRKFSIISIPKPIKNPIYISSISADNIQKNSENKLINSNMVEYYYLLLNTFDNKSEDSGLRKLIQYYDIGYIFEQNDDKNNKKITYIESDEDNYVNDFFQNYMINVHKFVCETILNLSLSDKIYNNLSPLITTGPTSRFQSVTTSPAPITPTIEKTKIIKIFYQIITSTLTIPLNKIYIDPEKYKNIFDDTSDTKTINESDVYGRFLSYYNIIYNLKSIYRYNECKIGSNVVISDSTNSQQDTISINDEHNTLILIKIIRYFLFYDYVSTYAEEDIFKSEQNVSIDNLNLYIYNLNQILTNEISDMLCVNINKLDISIFTKFKILDDSEVKNCNKKVYPYIHFNTLFSNTYDESSSEETRFIKEAEQITSRSDFFKYFSDLYDSLNEIIYLYNTVGPIENFHQSYQNKDDFTIRNILLLFSMSIVKLKKLYISINNSETVYLSPNEQVIFKNMYNVVLKLPTVFSLDTNNKKSVLNNNKKNINNDNNVKKGWNIYGYSEKSNPNTYYLYRKNTEFEEYKNYYNEIFSDIHLIYIYYAILFFVTNPEQIMQ